ncbi:helix-turn-helix domain-containing protein [Limosilactobacillus mucosae]|uniref:helix-turn-helix domain-containing protein n=1 Tax=Limosilactobacillus mucosae TaxID=97478 RepID=UPI0039925497
MKSYFIEMLTDQPRRTAVLRNTVKNKRTVATLFWAREYGVLKWLGSNPRLTVNEFEQWLVQMRQAGLIKMNDQTAWLTPSGIAEKEKFIKTHYQPQFGKWSWLARPDQLAPRVLLATQAVSQYAHRQKHYVPLNLAPAELYFVHRWFYENRNQIVDDWASELQQAATDLARLDERLAKLLVFSLPGYQTTGWTIDQAAQALKVSVDEAMIMERDVWLGIAYLAARQSASLLRSLLSDHLHETPLSRSAAFTLRMFEQGFSLEQISQRRHLKLGTIREHILETAIFMPRSLMLDRLLTPTRIDQLAAQYHGKPATWEFRPPILEPQSPADKLQNEQSFFEYRLFQIIKGGERNG